jgi:hypothetical protein
MNVPTAACVNCHVHTPTQRATCVHCGKPRTTVIQPIQRRFTFRRTKEATA